MKNNQFINEPSDSADRKKAQPVICYPIEELKASNISIYQEARKHLEFRKDIIIPPRDAKCFSVKAGQFFRIESIEGAQVGDLNLFQADNLHVFSFLRFPLDTS